MQHYTYFSKAFNNFENLMSISIHVIFLIFFIYKMRKEKALIPLIFSSQVPLVMFPFFRFSWSLHDFNIPLFLFVNLICLCYFIYKHSKIETTKTELFLGFFILAIIFSLIGNKYNEVSYLSANYAICWLITFFLAFTCLGENKRVTYISLYVFFISSFIMIFSGIVFYLHKFGYPTSLEKIYQNKLKFTYNTFLTLQTFGNIHNINPFLFFINIISFSFLLCSSGQSQKLHDISKLINLKARTLYLTFAVNFISSLLLLLLFISRGALLLAIATYVYLIFHLKKEKKGIYITSLFFIFSLLSLSRNIRDYFLTIFYSFLDIITGFFNNSLPHKSLSDASVLERLQALKIGLQIIQDNFLFGIGFENYSQIETIYTSPHNFIIQYVAETGIFGIFFIFCLIFYILKELFYQKNEFLFCLMFSIFCFISYITIFGGQLFHAGMLVNGLTLFYFLFVYDHLSLQSKRQKNKDSFKNLESELRLRAS